MCDTFALPSGYSEDHVTYFAKNSDRSPNEPHLVVHVPAKQYPKGSTVSCTYISIPQAEYTHEAILCKPSWMWGAEMGVNDARVAIGNETVFTRAKRGEPALTGMDILRLALERSDTAAAAIETMIALLETYGQGGNCGFDKPFFYDNSFLVADPDEVYIMETSGKNYAVVRSGSKCAISNRLTIGAGYRSPAGTETKTHFSKRYSNRLYSFFSGARERRQQVMDRLAPGLKAAGLFDILRSHEPVTAGHEFSRGSVKSVCMHGGGLIGDHTTGSLVAVLRRNKPVTLWCTGASTPCISAFKPVFFGSDTAPVFSDPGRSTEYWLQRERLHRAVLAGLADPAVLRGRISELESVWLSREQEILSDEVPAAAGLYTLSREANLQEQALIEEFSVPDWRNIRGRSSFAGYWQRKNTALGVNSAPAGSYQALPE